MSDQDDPFGSKGRTVFRPNPGGRRPMAPVGPPASKSPADPPWTSPPAGWDAARPPPPPGWEPTAPTAPRPASDWNSDPWLTDAPVRDSYRQPPSMPPLMPAPPVHHTPPAITGVGGNPLLRAAGPLLLLLGRLRAAMSRGATEQLLGQVTQSLAQFDADVRAAGVELAQINPAKYALAATADDIMQNLPQDGRQVWTQYSMLARLFGERTGGIRFFEELDRAMANPSLNVDLLELMHACLSLGFEGIHRTSAGGAGTLEQIRRDIYRTIANVRSKTPADLSPHWKGQPAPPARFRYRIPVWSVAVVAGVSLLAAFFLLRTALARDAGRISSELAQVNALAEGQRVMVAAAPLTTTRPATPNTPPRVVEAEAITTDELVCVQRALSDEVTSGNVAVSQVGNGVRIVTQSALFRSGRSDVSADGASVVAAIAEALASCGDGAVQVVGYTDSDPIVTAAFASNQALSEARANSVAGILRNTLGAARVSAAGRGELEPVAPNTTPEGRQLNRRVEITLRIDGGVPL